MVIMMVHGEWWQTGDNDGNANYNDGWMNV